MGLGGSGGGGAWLHLSPDFHKFPNILDAGGQSMNAGISHRAPWVGPTLESWVGAKPFGVSARWVA